MTDSRMMKCGFSILFVAAIVLLAGVVRASTVRNGFFVFRLRLGTHCHAGTGFSRDSPPDWEKRFPFAYFRLRDATNKRMNPALSVWLAIPGDPAWDNAAAQNLFFRMKQEAPAFPRDRERAIERKIALRFNRLAFCRQCEWCTMPRFQPSVFPSRHSAGRSPSRFSLYSP